MKNNQYFGLNDKKEKFHKIFCTTHSHCIQQQQRRSSCGSVSSKQKKNLQMFQIVVQYKQQRKKHVQPHKNFRDYRVLHDVATNCRAKKFLTFTRASALCMTSHKTYTNIQTDIHTYKHTLTAYKYFNTKQKFPEAQQKH